MTNTSFYTDLDINNEYVFLESFDKVSNIQYNIIFGKWDM